MRKIGFSIVVKPFPGNAPCFFFVNKKKKNSCTKLTERSYFNDVLGACQHLYFEQVKQPTATDPIPPEIEENDDFVGYFDDCFGAIDGTHIPAHLPNEISDPFRDRNHNLTQNVLGVCSFDLRFTYVLPGWEGSAHDGHVLSYALAHDFKVPPGKFYLADAGYGNKTGFLTPYRGVRYHLKEQMQACQR
jgi:hypothetical protein